jgi:hypothetical protein
MLTFLATLIPWAKKFWKPIALALAVGAVVWYVWSAITTYGQERYDAGFAKRDAQYQTELDKVKQDYVRQIENLQKVNNALSTSYQGALTAIRDRPAPRTVRVCNSTPGSVPEASGTGAASGSDGPAKEGLPQTAGPDIGPFLYGEADTADALAEQLAHLQSWVAQVCVNPDRLRTTF